MSILPQTREAHERIARMSRLSDEAGIWPNSAASDAEVSALRLARENERLRTRNAYLEDWAERANAELERHGLLTDQQTRTERAQERAPAPVQPRAVLANGPEATLRLEWLRELRVAHGITDDADLPAIMTSAVVEELIRSLEES